MELVALVERIDHVCTRYRLKALTPGLAQLGMHLTLCALPKTMLGRVALYRQLRHVDAVIIQRVLLPRLELRVLRTFARHLIFDYDDAVWLRDSYHPRGVRSAKRLTRFQATCAMADTLLAGNAFLAESAAQPGRVTIVPTVVEPADYPVATHESSGADSRLIWIGSGSTLAGLTRILEHFAAIGRRLPRIGLQLVCDQAVELPGIAVELVPWSQATEATMLARADIGISWIPDDDWSRGKCGLKLIQYLAAGLPALANPVGVQNELLAGGAGRIATTPKEWAEAVYELAHDPARRWEMGQIGRKRIIEHYSVRRAVELWGNALRLRPPHGQ